MISAIVPTVGRPEMLRLCLESLSKQTVRVSEVVVVHCGDDEETFNVTNDPRWSEAGSGGQVFSLSRKGTAPNNATSRLNVRSTTTFC